MAYHGPGQLVLYPILDLQSYGLDLHRYSRNLEEVMICTAKAFGVRAQRRTGFPGAWAKGRKLGAVGIHVNGWVTLHRLAPNVGLHPNGFDLIVLCGLARVRTVSMPSSPGAPSPWGEAGSGPRACCGHAEPLARTSFRAAEAYQAAQSGP